MVARSCFQQGSGPARRYPSLAYPALLGCMTRGRAPSNLDVETVAARMWIELGRGRIQAWDCLERGDPRRRRILAAARAALTGGDPARPGRRSPLVPRGH